WRDLGITRWCEDATRDDWGAYVFLRDVRSGDVWSTGYQPSGVEPASYDVRFSEDRAEFIRRDGTITTVLEIVVSPEDDAEVRRLSVSNGGNRVRDIELTSYAELALAPPAADVALERCAVPQKPYMADVKGQLAEDFAPQRKALRE